MNIIQLRSIKNLHVLKESIKEYFGIILKQGKPLYFVTLTFPITWRQKALQDHLSKIRYYLKLTNRRKKVPTDNFDYIWIKEEGKNRNIHFHLIINWNYHSYGQVQKDWNYIIGEAATTPSTHVDRIYNQDSLNKCINYIFKELMYTEDDGRIQNYGLSLNCSHYLTNEIKEKRIILPYTIL